MLISKYQKKVNERIGLIEQQAKERAEESIAKYIPCWKPKKPQ